MKTTYLPAGAYQALVADLACALSAIHDTPAAQLHAVTDVLTRHGYDRPEVAQALAAAEPWPYLDCFEPDQVRIILGESGDFWPATIREDVPGDQDDRLAV